MKKLFNVDQLSVMILAGVIMALAWGCKREAKAINDVACESTSNNVDLVFITNYYGLITVDDGNLLVSDICLNTNSLNIDDLFLTIDDSFIVTVDDGCKINTPKGKYIVTNGVIEDVTDEFTEKAISDWIDIPGAIVPSNTIRGFHGETTSSVHTAEVVIEEDFIQYVVTNGVIEEVVEEETCVTETNFNHAADDVIGVETDVRWMEPITPDGLTYTNFLGETTFYDCRVLFGFGTETNGTITNRIYGRLGVLKVDDRHVVIWEPVE